MLSAEIWGGLRYFHEISLCKPSETYLLLLLFLPGKAGMSLGVF